MRALVLLHYDGRQWAPVEGSQDAATEGQVCATGGTTFSPFAVGYANAVPRFVQSVALQTYLVNEAIAPLRLPAAAGGDGTVRYMLTPAVPAGLSYTPPVDPTAAGGVVAGTPTEGQRATDVDGDEARPAFMLTVEVSIADAIAKEATRVEFGETLSRALARAVTEQWTADRPGSATPGDDYQAEAAGRLVLQAGTLVEPLETFTVTVRVPADQVIEGTATGMIEDDTEQARRRSVGMVLADVGGRWRRTRWPCSGRGSCGGRPATKCRWEGRH